MDDFLRAKNRTIGLLQKQVDGLANIKSVCVKKCNYDKDVIAKMEKLYRLVRFNAFTTVSRESLTVPIICSPVNAISCQPLCQSFAYNVSKPRTTTTVPPEKKNGKKCANAPDVESATGLVKMAPPSVADVRSYEAPAGGNLTYICRGGRVLDRATGARTVVVPCGGDGRYSAPEPWPKCV